MSELDWKQAEEHLAEVRRQYTEIGAAGILGLTIVLNPLLVRLARGERTPELHAEIMATE